MYALSKFSDMAYSGKIQVYLLMLVFGFTMTKVVSKMICQNMEV